MKNIFLVAAAAVVLACGRETSIPDPSEWMTSLPDDIPACTLSIPGAHDACTAGVGVEYEWFRTQALSIQEMWDAGVRFFDLRPAANDTVLEIYHIVADTHISFEEVVGVLADNLRRHPGEFAMVVFRHEDDGDTSDNWEELMGGYLNSLPEGLTADFREDATLGELRGRIIFLGRSQYENGPVGGYVSRWNEVYSEGPGNVTNSNGETVPVFVQDYYAPQGKEDKMLHVLEMLDSTAHKQVWTVNHTSAYLSTGYGENSQNVNSDVADHISGMEGKAGIVVMDFAGVDVFHGALVRDSTLTMVDWNVSGKKLTDAVIAQNFKNR